MAFNPTDGKLYICDGSNDRVQILDTDLGYCGEITGRREGNGKFRTPQGVAFDEDGNVYIACPKQIQVFTTKGEYSLTIGSRGSGPGQLNNAEGIAVDQDKVFVADFKNDCVSIFNTAGQFLHAFGTNGEEPGEFSFARGMSIDGNGYILVADNNCRIQIFWLRFQQTNIVPSHHKLSTLSLDLCNHILCNTRRIFEFCILFDGCVAHLFVDGSHTASHVKGLYKSPSNLCKEVDAYLSTYLYL